MRLIGPLIMEKMIMVRMRAALAIRSCCNLTYAQEADPDRGQGSVGLDASPRCQECIVQLGRPAVCGHGRDCTDLRFRSGGCLLRRRVGIRPWIAAVLWRGDLMCAVPSRLESSHAAR